jgi:hypothetical protein
MLLWSDGKWRIPLAIRIWRKGGPTKPDLALEMLSDVRNKLGWKPICVLFDAGYAAAKILRRIHDYGWVYVCQCPCSRTLNGIKLKQFKKQGYWRSSGKAWYGQKVLVIRHEKKYYLCNRLSWSRKEVMNTYKERPVIEETFRVLKQTCGWIGCQLRDEGSYRRHLYLCLIAFLVLEHTRVKASEPTTIYQIRQNAMSGNKLFCPAIMKRLFKVA